MDDTSRVPHSPLRPSEMNRGLILLKSRSWASLTPQPASTTWPHLSIAAVSLDTVLASSFRLMCAF